MDLSARCVRIWMVFVIYIAVGVEGVAFDEACTVDGDCTEANTVCTTMKCACSADSFRKDTTECATKIALTDPCTAGQPTDQCADLNAECDATALTCGCKSAHFVNKDGACAAQIAALEGPCDATDSASDQCAVPDSECRTDGTDKCLCKATHYTDGGACEIRKKPSEGCAANQCVTHATCTAAVCECDAGYTATPTMCSGAVKVTILTYMYVVPILVSMMFFHR